MEKKGFSVNGKKIGRPPMYKTKDDKDDARRAQQRLHVNRKRAKVRDALAAAKVEAEAEVEAEDEDEVPLVPMPETVNVEDEVERLAHCVRTKSKQKKGEFVFDRIEQFGTIVNVAADGNCGYHALMAALDYNNKKCKMTVREVRRDIWEFGMNRKYYLDQKFNLSRIFKEKLKYTGTVGRKHWMNSAEVGPMAAELYDILVYVYWIDDNNTKKTIAYRPNRDSEMHDGGFVSMFKADRTQGAAVVRLFCENKQHFQWVKLGTVVKSKLAEGARDGLDLTEEVGEVGDAKETGEAKEEEMAEGKYLTQEVEEIEEVEAEEETNEVEWEENEVVAEVVGVEDVRLVVSGPHTPRQITGRAMGEECMAYDRQRLQRASDRNASTEMTYPATLGPLWCLNGKPWETVVHWTNYAGTGRETSVIPYADIIFADNLGRGKRNKRKTAFYENEQEPVRGANKEKARHDNSKKFLKTMNKDYNGIVEMLGDNNVSNEDFQEKIDQMNYNLIQVTSPNTGETMRI